MNDTVGIDGVEYAFEDYLRGESGTLVQELNTSGKVVSESWRVDPATGESQEPDPGDNVMLTLDLRLQEKVEQVLADTIEGLEGDTEGGAMVVQSVNDGGILAMASYPTYDLSTVYSSNEAYRAAADNPLKPFTNRATSEIYSPGSTFKPLVAIAALEEGVVTPEEEIRDTGRLLLPEEDHYPYGDWHPPVLVLPAVRRPPRPGKPGGGPAGLLQHLLLHHRPPAGDRAHRPVCRGLRPGPDHRPGAAGGGGPGGRAGDQRGPGPGLVRRQPAQRRHRQDNTMVTPLQLTNYISTLVNGGNHYATHLLKTVKTSDFSGTVYEYEPELLSSLELDPENVEAVKQGMWLVANDPESSSSVYFRDLPVEVGAKTGSAQVSSEVEADALFVCFAPYDDPRSPSPWWWSRAPRAATWPRRWQRSWTIISARRIPWNRWGPKIPCSARREFSICWTHRPFLSRDVRYKQPYGASARRHPGKFCPAAPALRRLLRGDAHRLF